jgi:hypothetical protein
MRALVEYSHSYFCSATAPLNRFYTLKTVFNSFEPKLKNERLLAESIPKRILPQQFSLSILSKKKRMRVFWTFYFDKVSS